MYRVSCNDDLNAGLLTHLCFLHYELRLYLFMSLQTSTVDIYALDRSDILNSVRWPLLPLKDETYDISTGIVQILKEHLGGIVIE
jgi:hypothetical protein